MNGRTYLEFAGGKKEYDDEICRFPLPDGMMDVRLEWSTWRHFAGT